MMTVPRHSTAKLAALAALLLFPLGASAELTRVGPNSASNGFPEWYQDSTGVVLELCLPQTAAELAGGHCLILPGDVPNSAALPESFPSNWAGEHFYWQAFAEGAGNGVTGSLEFALESTFANGDPVPGEQIVFGRVRIRIDPLTLGADYNVYTPYGVHRFTAADNGKGGGEINFTEDIGFACPPGNFDCALQSNVGPFLLPADQAGGNELAPFAEFGRRYIASPTRIGPVTGSPLTTDHVLINGQTRNPNIFLLERVSDGAIIFETPDFALIGRLFEGTLAARVRIDRASYASDTAGTQLDVFATAFPTVPPRIPGQAEPAAIVPQLAFYELPCVGDAPPYTAPLVAPTPLAQNGSVYWAQKENPATIPNEVCVSETVGTAAPIFLRAPLGDQISIARAVYTPATRTLTVDAKSSDPLGAELSLGAFGNAPATLFDAGVATITLPVDEGAPPSIVRVFSNQGGQNEAQVTTRGGAITPATGVTLTPSLASPQVAGTPVTFTAQGQGSTDPYEYRFWLYSNGTWQIIQDYSTDNTWTLPASTPAGSYAVSVHVRTTPGSEFDAVLGLSVQYVLEANFGVTMTASIASPQPAGTQVTFTAQGQGSTEPYEYRFWLKSNGGAWQIVQDYGTDNTWALPATLTAGNYEVSVHMRTSPRVEYDAILDPAMTYVLEPAAGPAAGVTLTPSAASPQLAGTEVTFTAQGHGSTLPYQYRFWLKSGGTWRVVQDYGTSNTWTLPASTRSGTYEVSVHVRTSAGVEFDAVLDPAMTYVLQPSAGPAAGVTLTPSAASPQPVGTEVTFTAQGQGSTSTYEYRFWLKGTGGWEIVQDYSIDNTWVLPASTLAGTYEVSVHVRTSAGVEFDAYLDPAMTYVMF